MFGRRRSARGEEFEYDPRFIDDGKARGRVAPTTSNWGSRSILPGTDINAAAKLLRLEGDGTYPWQVSVTSKLEGGVAPVLGPVVTGNFGSGGSFNRVEFDARPDQTLQLPGAAIDLDVSWEPTWRMTAVNAGALILPELLDASLLPERAIVSGVACHGETARGQATRTQRVTSNTVAGGFWLIEVPPYADHLFVATSTDASYNLITSLGFLPSTNPAGVPMLSYTGAELLALKNAGQPIPLPGTTVAVRLELGAGVPATYRFIYSLSL